MQFNQVVSWWIDEEKQKGGEEPPKGKSVLLFFLNARSVTALNQLIASKLSISFTLSGHFVLASWGTTTSLCRALLVTLAYKHQSIRRRLY